MKIKILLVIALIITGIIAISNYAKGQTNFQEEYNGYLEQARIHAEKEIPYVSLQYYEKAMKLDNTKEDIYLEYMEQAKALNEGRYFDALDKYREVFPQSVNAYEMLCDFYYEKEMYLQLLPIALEANEKGIATDKIKNYYIECGAKFRILSSEFKQAGSFVGEFAIIQTTEDMYGYVNGAGKLISVPKYQDVTIFMGGQAAVKLDDKWEMVNPEGYRVAVPSKDVDYLGIVNNGCVLYSLNGKYDYMGSDLVVPDKETRFEDATHFKNSVAAVKKDGKWGLINSGNEMITDFIFDDVIRDEYNTCINNGVIFVKKDGKYYMCNAQGAKITDKAFDDAYPFVSTEPAAVCVDGKWGFVDGAGNMVIEPQYESAKSFNIGYAPVCKDGLWGYINNTNNLRIDYQFIDCKPFSSNGVTSVIQQNKEEDNRNWIYIILYKYI